MFFKRFWKIGGGPGGPGDMQAMFKQVKVWTRVQLASAK